MTHNLYLKKFNLTLVIILLFAAIANAQNLTGQIAGIVKTTFGKPAPGVTVTIKELNKRTSTDENGAYQFKNVQPGNYLLKVTFIGSKSAEKAVTVTANETATVDFSISESYSELKEVNVNAGKTANTIPVKIGKANLNQLDMPQSTG